jgi:hypothetical protein
MDFVIGKDVLGQGTLNLSVLHIFNSRRFRSITEGPTFYTASTSSQRFRQINLTLNYRINQAKLAKAKKEGEDF